MLRKLIVVLILSWVIILLGCFSKTDKEDESVLKEVRATKKYSSVYIRANSTYYEKKPMKYMGNNIWEVQQSFGNSSSERFRFYAYGEENLVLGDNEPDRVVEKNGAYIKVKCDKICIIRFNEISNRYTIKYIDKVSYWGLGNIQSEVKSNDRNYEWYIDQKGTGDFENVNCGPSCAVMAIKWKNKEINITVEEARKKAISYHEELFGISETNMGEILYDVLGKNCVIDLKIAKNQELLKEKIDNGSIIIARMEMGYIELNSNENQRVNKFTSKTDGHFIILKGYRIVDGQFYWEVYDPYSWGERYKDDGTLKGKNRYYKKEEVELSIGHCYEILR